MVFNGDLENKSFHQTKEKFTEKYSKLIEAGRLELVSAPLDYYPQYIFQHGKGIGKFKVYGYLSPHGDKAVKFSSLISA